MRPKLLGITRTMKLLFCVQQTRANICGLKLMTVKRFSFIWVTFCNGHKKKNIFFRYGVLFNFFFFTIKKWLYVSPIKALFRISSNKTSTAFRSYDKFTPNENRKQIFSIYKLNNDKRVTLILFFILPMKRIQNAPLSALLVHYDVESSNHTSRGHRCTFS